MLFKYETHKGKDCIDLKDTLLQECLWWFGTKETWRGKFAALAIVYSGSSPIFVVLSIDYGGNMDVAMPKLTACVCEKKAISDSCPREALCSFFGIDVCQQKYRTSMREL